MIYAPAKIVSGYGQEITHSQTADKPMTPRGRAAQSLQKLVSMIEEEPQHIYSNNTYNEKAGEKM